MASNEDLTNIDWVSLGAQLQNARKAAGITQEQAADALGVSRPTMVAIEQGKRRSNPTELTSLAALYGQEVNTLLRQRITQTDLSVAFRARLERKLLDVVGETNVDQAVAKLKQHAENYLELEVMLGSKMVRRYPAEYTYSGLGVQIAADEIARQERDRLGLGDGPISDLRSLLETEVGLRIFYLDLPSQIAGMFGYTDELGGCIAINSKHPPERQRMTLAHEYAHFLTQRSSPEVKVLSGYERRPESERFADAFAVRFLLPDGGIRRQLRAHVQAGGEFTLGDLLHFARYFGVSFEAYSYRLEEMGILESGSTNRFKDEGLKVRKAQEIVGVNPELSTLESQTQLLPDRYELLAVRAHLEAQLTEGQLMRFLGLPQLETRLVVEKRQHHFVEGADGLPESALLALEEPVVVRSR